MGCRRQRRTARPHLKCCHATFPTLQWSTQHARARRLRLLGIFARSPRPSTFRSSSAPATMTARRWTAPTARSLVVYLEADQLAAFLYHAQFVMRNGDTERALRAAQPEAHIGQPHQGRHVPGAEPRTEDAVDGADRPYIGDPRSSARQADYAVTQQLEHVIDAAQRLNAIVSDIMLLSKAVAGNPREQFSTCILSEVLEDGLAGSRPRPPRGRCNSLSMPPDRRRTFPVRRTPPASGAVQACRQCGSVLARGRHGGILGPCAARMARSCCL